VVGEVRLAPHLLRRWMEPMHRAMLAEVRPNDERHGLVGANMAVSRECFDRVEGFDPALGPGAWRRTYSWNVRFAPRSDAFSSQKGLLQSTTWIPSVWSAPSGSVSLEPREGRTRIFFITGIEDQNHSWASGGQKRRSYSVFAHYRPGQSGRVDRRSIPGKWP
jgi:hypothetical protein